MDTNDGIEKYESGETQKEAFNTDDIETTERLADISHIVAPEKEDFHSFSTYVLELTVSHPNHLNWATLEVMYWWNPSGTEFTCRTTRYKVSRNGRNKGNIIFGFKSNGLWTDREITNDDAIQDANWHAITSGGSVTGNVADALIYFKYIFDVPNGDFTAQVARLVPYAPPAPTITNPGVVRTARPTLQGTGVANATIKLYQSGVSTVIFATAPVLSNNTWTAPLTESLWMADPFNLTASQTVHNSTSGWAETVSFAVLFKPEISNVTVSADGKPTISGTGGLAGATLEIWKSGGGGGVQLITTVKSGGDWSVTATTPWAVNTYIITAKQIGQNTGQQSDWALVKTFVVKPPKPVISPPPNPAEPEQVLTITGVSSGTVTLEMFNEAGTKVPGTFSTSGVSRTFTPTAQWTPGTNKVKVVQTVNGVPSDSSELCTFAAKPAKPAITPPPNPADPEQVLTITGVSSGTVTLEMFNEAGTKVPGTFSTSGVSRTFTPTAQWTPGTNKVKVVQTVNGVPSDPSELCTFAARPAKPAITPPPNPAEPKQVLTITGVSSGTVTLEMFNEAGTKVPGTFSTSGVSRTFTPTAQWTPGTNKVKVVQTVNGVPSDSSELCTFAARPAKPAITPPPNPAEPEQVLTITGVSSGTVTLEMFNEAGTKVPGTFSTSGVSRTFTPTAQWTPGTNKVKVVQTVNGVPSDSSELCTFAAKPAKPAITPPPNPAEPEQVLTITGVSSGTVTLEMFNEAGTKVPGTFSTSGVSRTFTPTAQWTPGTNKVKVVQTVNGVPSDPSELCTFVVGSTKLAITPPAEPADEKQMLTITGVSSGTVELEILTFANKEVPGTFSTTGTTRTFIPTGEWQPLANIVKVRQTVAGVPTESETCAFIVKLPKPAITEPPSPAEPKQELTVTRIAPNNVGYIILEMFNEADIKVDGSFSPSGTSRTFTPTAQWAPGTNKVKVVQSVDNWKSEPSDWCTFTAKPAKPAIVQPTHPAEPEQVLTITGVSSGTVSLEMFNEADVKVTGTFSTSGVSRTFTPAAEWTPGTNKVKVVQTVNGVPSDPSELCTFAAKPAKPAITPPPNPAEVKQVLTITGVYSGATLQMFNDADVEVDGTFNTSGTGSTFTPTEEWAPGTNKVRVVQTVDDVPSDPSEECAFTVEEAEDKPDAPRFALPLAGSKTPTRPPIRVTGGLPLALITVRLVGSEAPLHSDTADAQGELEFAVTTPLVPGSNAIEVKQKSGNTESDWSMPHSFTVKEPPKTPVIDAPTAGSSTTRKPTIRGKGETRGTILLRREDDPENLIASINGVTSWRWTARESWDVGMHIIEVQQTDDGDSSSWSEPRTFKVVDARYGFSDAGPVLAQPVVSNHESVLLRVQVVSGVTGEVAEGVEVEWEIVDEQAVKAITVTDPNGWARYLYTPGTAGEHTVKADLTIANLGVAITELFEVTALADSAWENEFELYLAGEKVDLANGDLALLRGKPYALELKVNSASPLIGSSVTLQDLWEAETLGLNFAPPLGTPQEVVEGQSVHWTITSGTGEGGYFGLKLISPKLPEWQLPGRMIAEDLSEEVDVYFDTFAKVFGGDPAYPCLGATHTVTVQPKAHSLLLGKEVILEVTEEAASLEVVVSPEPSIPQKLGANGASWTFNCVDSRKSGNFSVRLRVLEWNLSSLELPMSLGHNKVKITQRYGPAEWGHGYWRYGVLAVSTFTGQAAAGVPVIIKVSGNSSEGRTQGDGWVYVSYPLDQHASFVIHNLYDASTVYS